MRVTIFANVIGAPLYCSSVVTSHVVLELVGPDIVGLRPNRATYLAFGQEEDFIGAAHYARPAAWPLAHHSSPQCAQSIKWSSVKGRASAVRLPGLPTR
jgi:hypothetical protein